MPIYKDDRDLTDSESFSPASKIHFYLKRIPIRPHLVQVNLFQYFSFKTFESASGILNRHACNDTCIKIGEVAEQKPGHRPVNHINPTDISRTDDDITGLKFLQEFGNHVRVV